jgi:hypothetical protein
MGQSWVNPALDPQVAQLTCLFKNNFFYNKKNKKVKPIKG